MSIRQKIVEFAKYQRTVRELSQLSNHQLRDLGISRADIRDLARTIAN